MHTSKVTCYDDHGRLKYTAFKKGIGFILFLKSSLKHFAEKNIKISEVIIMRYAQL
jgi:hypothetical protein